MLFFCRKGSEVCILIALVVFPRWMHAQDARELVRRAADTEIAANHTDRTPWIYRQVDQQPGNSVTQWVAETHSGDLKRVLEKNGVRQTREQQQAALNAFIHDDAARAKAKKAGQHDDQETETMIRTLPDAFLWKVVGRDSKTTSLQFEPDPAYKAPTYEARVLGAMTGEMRVDNQQHRIVALKGHLTHDVVFGMGVFGRLKAGGFFEMQREEIMPGKWQITSTHVHMQGKALFFKTISEQEDDVHSEFQAEPEDVTLEQAVAAVMSKPE